MHKKVKDGSKEMATGVRDHNFYFLSFCLHQTDLVAYSFEGDFPLVFPWLLKSNEK
jgi:hypothetical protein